LLYNKKILALVPARSGSKGIKNKNLRFINGKPLIQYTLDFISKLKFIDLKIVSSDSIKILELAKKHNFTAIKRSKILSADLVSDYRVIKSILNNPEVIKSKCDYLIYLQPTSPIRKKHELTFALKKIIKENLNSGWSISKIDKKNHPLKVLTIKKKKLILYNFKGKNIIARQQLDDIFIRNGVFYIFSIKELIKNRSIYLDKVLPVEINHEIVNIDNSNDLKIAKKLLKKHKF
jgi:CMP-N,N'-diacetyllegionaminic acid synthase|tara:strand:- start:3498 stop:4199 length:702 start_codon:yes stop_codon:yes gene_type:complete